MFCLLIIFKNLFFSLILFLYLITDNDVETTLIESQTSLNNHSSSSTATMTASTRQQHVFQHQSSVNSITSIQTVLHQAVQNSNAHNSNFIQSNSNGTNGGHSNQSGSLISLVPQGNNTNSTNAGQNDDILNIADVADLLHPQHAIITGIQIIRK